MPEFERAAKSSRQSGKKILQQRRVIPQERGKLEENSAQLRVQHLQHLTKAPEDLSAIPQLPHMSDFLRRFQAEAKFQRRGSGPVGERLLARNAVKAVVDFRRGEV